MRKLIILGVTISIFTMVVGIKFFSPKRLSEKSEPNASRQTDELARAKKLLEQGKVEEALDIIYAYRREIESLTENGRAWLQLLIDASIENRNISQLVLLYELHPDSFKERENGSLLVADAYISDNRPDEYKKLRSFWEGRETQDAAWFVLDVDHLLLARKKQEAINKLKSRKFQGKADVGRLLRLALLVANEDNKKAWLYLDEAYSIDPANPEIRLYRAKLYEDKGEISLAHKEYQTAAELDKQNLLLKDQLADFYIRQKQFPMATAVWKQILLPSSSDIVWLKAYFWQKITTPIDFDWRDAKVPPGKLEPLIQSLISLGPSTFWDNRKLEHLPNLTNYLQTQQETFWLRLINNLINKQEEEVDILLTYNPFQESSWFPELEVALKRVLAYRKNRKLSIEGLSTSVDDYRHGTSGNAKLPIFFQELELFAAKESDSELPDSLSKLILSDEVFSALFLSAGWYEAGLQLHRLSLIPNDFPDWVAFNITNGLNKNRSTEDALNFAFKQKQTPQLVLLAAELMISQGNSSGALEKLDELSLLDSEIGYRASWLASLIYIDQKKWEQARKAVLSHSKLSEQVLGKETLARIAYLEGDTDSADKLYEEIEDSSPEARSYLAKRAFADKNWERAKKLTQQLLVDYPDNPSIQKNLQIINKEIIRSRKAE